MTRKINHILHIRAKLKSHYICEICGSTEFIQAHHKIPGDDTSLIALCGVCHSKQHPYVPLGLFFSKNKQPYWENKSASSIAKEMGVHPRTIYRRAKRLGIEKGTLSKDQENELKNTKRILIILSSDNAVGRALINIMEKENMSLLQFSKIIGIANTTLSMIIKGRRNPSLNIARAIYRKYPDLADVLLR